jgi:hypothetical protein
MGFKSTFKGLIRDNIMFAVYIISSAKERTIPLYVSAVISFARQKFKDLIKSRQMLMC